LRVRLSVRQYAEGSGTEFMPGVIGVDGKNSFQNVDLFVRLCMVVQIES
jgi:hypothetical protein